MSPDIPWDLLKASPALLRLASIIFLISLALRLGFAFFDGHQVLFNACDASEYIDKALELQCFAAKPASFWWDSLGCLLGTLPPERSASITDSYKSLEELCRRSGPLFPLFIFLTCLAGGGTVSQTNLVMPVLVQCLMSAMVPALLVYIGTKLWNLKIGVIAGLLAAFYPGFIINSARLLSEPFASFWLVLALAMILRINSQKRTSCFSAFVSGLSLGFMQLSRSALSLVTLLFIFFSLVQNKFELNKRKLANMLFLILGLAGPIVAFISLQFLVTGKPDLMVDRLSRYNLFVGMNLESHGWLVYPYPNFTGVVDSSHFEILRAKIEQAPWRFLSLIMDKPPRLFAFPWNDFKTPMGPIPFSLQVIYHQLCLFFALAGLSLAVFYKDKSKGEENNEKLIGRLLLLLVILLHFSYMAFITLPRYALTSIPIVLLFAAAGIFILVKEAKDSKNKKIFFLFGSSALILFLSSRGNATALSLAILPALPVLAALVICSIAKFATGVGAFLALYLISTKKELYSFGSRICVIIIGAITIPLVSLPLNAYGNPYELSKETGDKTVLLEQSVTPPPNKQNTKPGPYYLLIDGEGISPSSIGISINGKAVAEPPIPLMPFVQYDHPFHTKKDGTVTYDLEAIVHSIMHAAGGTNMDLRQWFLIKAPAELAPNKQDITVKLECHGGKSARVFGSYITKKNQVILPGFYQYSFEKAFYGIENPYGISDIRYNSKLALHETNANSGSKRLAYNIRLYEGPNSIEALSDTLNNKTKVVEVKESKGDTIELKLSDFATFSRMKEKKPALLKTKVEVDSAEDGILPVMIECEFTGQNSKGDKFKYISPWVPSRFLLDKGKNEISFCVPVMPDHLGGSLTSARIAITPGGPSMSNQFLGVRKDRLSAHGVRFQRLSMGMESLNLPVPLSKGRIF